MWILGFEPRSSWPNLGPGAPPRANLPVTSVPLSVAIDISSSVKLGVCGVDLRNTAEKKQVSQSEACTRTAETNRPIDGAATLPDRADKKRAGRKG